MAKSPQVPHTVSVHITLTLEEINTIVAALGDRPFKEVYELIGRIHHQVKANQQEAS